MATRIIDTETGENNLQYPLGGIVPINMVIDLTQGWVGNSGPYFTAFEYWTEVADPTSSEGVSLLMEWQDDGGNMQSLGGVPIGLSLDRSGGMIQRIPLNLVKLGSFPYIWTVTFSVSNFNPVVGVGSSKIGFRICRTSADTITTNGDDIVIYPISP
jgi:hypothetical protein